VRVALAILLISSGCAEISGLEGLGVCDGACPDVTLDAPSSTEAGIDASDATILPDAIAKDATTDVTVDGPPIDATPPPCKQPSDCKNTEVCCETLSTKGSFFPSCTVDADTIACTQTAACPTTAPFSCGTYVLRRCPAAADCNETAAPKCCTFKFGDGGLREVCMSSQNANIIGATCL
jgi:hypothetical protein